MFVNIVWDALKCKSKNLKAIKYLMMNFVFMS